MTPPPPPARQPIAPVLAPDTALPDLTTSAPPPAAAPPAATASAPTGPAADPTSELTAEDPERA